MHRHTLEMQRCEQQHNRQQAYERISHLDFGSGVWGQQLQSAAPPIRPATHICAAAQDGQSAAHKGSRARGESCAADLRRKPAAHWQDSLHMRCHAQPLRPKLPSAYACCMGHALYSATMSATTHLSSAPPCASMANYRTIVQVTANLPTGPLLGALLG